MNKKTAVVIGSGFGGLAAAIRLQAAGISTTILEKRDKPGGRAYVYQDQGFTFDAGPTVITDPDCLQQLFALAGKDISSYIELMPIQPFYRLYWEDGYRFDYSNNDEKLFSQIRQKSPRDEQGYRQFLEYSKAVYRVGYHELGHVPFLNWGSMLRVAPQLIKMQAYRSVYHIVARYISDPHLRQAFSFHTLLIGGHPFRSSSIYALIHYLERSGGVFFPRGGTHALVRALLTLFTDLGGTYRLSAPVHSVVTREGRIQGVQWGGGDFLETDAVISNADVVHTYGELLKKEPRVRATARRLSRMKHSPSLFVVYFGTRRKFPELAHHNVMFGARYKELLNDIFDGPALPGDFSLYVHAPTRTDPSLAPEGGDAFYALSPVPHLEHAPLDWTKEGPRYAEKIIRYLDERYMPGLKESLVTQRIFTPADFAHELNAHWGSAFSLEPLLTQSAYFRTHNRDADIKGLYIVGAGTHPGAGIPGVVGSAKATASLVIDDLHPSSPRKRGAQSPT